MKNIVESNLLQYQLNYYSSVFLNYPFAQIDELKEYHFSVPKGGPFRFILWFNEALLTIE